MTQTYFNEPRGRDYWWYPVKVEAGANKIKIGAVTITITPGYYYQGFSADGRYPGLWTAIEASAPDGVTLHSCTPTQSSGQIGCGLEIRAGISVTTDLTIADAIPPELIGWASATTKSGTRVKSDYTLHGIWRSNSLVDGIASRKRARTQQVAFSSHRSPLKRITKWESHTSIDWVYEAVPALYVIAQRAGMQSYVNCSGVALGDYYAAFEALWLALTEGRRVLIKGDACDVPANLYGLSVLSYGESSLEDYDQIASLISAAQERYNLSFETYLIDDSPQEPA